MGEPSLDNFRRAYLANLELFNSHDFADAFAGFPAEFEWWSFDGSPFGRGPDGVAAAFVELVEDLAEWRVEPQEFTEVGPGRFLIACHGRGTGRVSGADPVARWFQLWEFEGGLPARVREFRARDEAVAATSALPR